MIRAYDVLVKRLKNAGVHPKKHVLDNEISENMLKQHIREQYKFTLELVPPGCHRSRGCNGEMAQIFLSSDSYENREMDRVPLD